MSRTPAWIRKLHFDFPSAKDINDLNATLNNIQKGKPVVSVVIPAFNEEKTIFNTVKTIGNNIFPYPFEIIVVDNNSTDKTAEIVRKLNVKYVFEENAGVGAARERGQLEARGNFVATADSDCFYPPYWLKTMYESVSRPGYVCGFSGHAFFDFTTPSYQFSIYEFFQKVMSEIRNLKRPYLNCHTMSMIYDRELGVKIGFSKRNIRGEDGRMCFDLMQQGKIQYIRSSKAKVWTFPRTLMQDGSLFNAFWIRIKKEISKIPQYFRKKEYHDTKTSEN